MHSWHKVLLSLFSPLFLFHCSQVECFLPSHFALAAVQLGRVRHSNSSNLHSSQAKIHPCHQKDWSAMFRSSICWTMRNLVMEPQYFHFVAVPKVLFFFQLIFAPSLGKIFQKWNIPRWCHLSIWNLFCYFRGFFPLQVSAETAVESGANTFPKFTTKHEYILTDTKHGYILTNISSKSSMNMYSQIYTKSQLKVEQAYFHRPWLAQIFRLM